MSGAGCFATCRAACSGSSRPTRMLARTCCARRPRRGVDASRLVFAPYAPTIEEHLGRLQLADIALDTAPYNSHSTGVDALWCGVPLVCMRGQRFAGRVAASIVSAAGLPELAAADLGRISANGIPPGNGRRCVERDEGTPRGSPPKSALFDTAGFARDLEALYMRMRDDTRQAGATLSGFAEHQNGLAFTRLVKRSLMSLTGPSKL